MNQEVKITHKWVLTEILELNFKSLCNGTVVTEFLIITVEIVI